MRSLVVALFLVCTASSAAAQSEEERAALIRRAQVWTESDIAAKDLRRGAASPDGFEPGATVRCDYVRIDPDGNSPKFTCRIGPSDDVKVKYGSLNGEVYAEVAATRLLWALGFGADRMYPVRVACRGCPAHIGVPSREPNERIVDPAAIERRVGAKKLGDDLAAWSWVELDLIDPAAGGAPAAHRDALKLLAVMLQHSDSKPEQQRLTCIDAACQQPMMMLNDVGLTFGRATFANENTLSSANLAAWMSAPVWKGSSGCIGNLPRSFTGTLRDPVIGDAGRLFLLGLLQRISDAQLTALFEVARFDHRELPADARAGGRSSVSAWVHALRAKQTEIADRHCPPDWSSQAQPLQGTGHVIWIQSWASTPLTIAMNAVSLLGYTRVYMFIALIVAVSIRPHAGAALLLLLATTAVLTDAAKTAASLPRPVAVDSRVAALSLTSHPEVLPDAVAQVFRLEPGGGASADAEDSYGFPSGHVAAATAFTLGLWLFTGWGGAGPLLLIWVPLMAVSRIYLGRHFALDVVGGVAVGVVAAALAWRLRLHLLDQPIRGTNIALRVLAGAMLIALCALLLRMPTEADAGRLLGLAAATLLIVRSGRRIDDMTTAMRATRATVAIALLAGAWWAVPVALEALGQSPSHGAGAMLTGALPLFTALAIGTGRGD